MDITKVVDKLGRLTEEVDALNEEISKLKSILKEYGVGVYIGSEYEIPVVKVETVTYDPAKVSRRLKPSQFLRVVNVSNTAVRKYLSQLDLNKCVLQVKETLKVNKPKKIKK